MNKDNIKELYDKLIEKLRIGRDWVLEHGKIVMPLFLVVCVLLTVVIALNANRHDKLEKKAEKVAQNIQENAEGESSEIPETPVYELEENAYPEINEVVNKYYVAQANGDIDTISELNTYLNDIEKLRIKQLSEYIDNYSGITVYTKPGMEEDTFVAFVCATVNFCDYDAALPGMQAFYISKNEDGSYCVNDGTYDSSVYDYIKNLSVQDDIVDLNNQVVVEYNNSLDDDPDLNDYIVYIKSVINEEVGEMLAEEVVPADQVEVEGTDNDNSTVATATIVSKVKAKESVNIRKSDSKDSDRIGTAMAGQEFTLIEKRDNGWSEIEYNGEKAFINSDYLEDSSTIGVEVNDTNEAEPASETAGKAKKANDTAKTDDEAKKNKEGNQDTGNTETNGTVTVNTSGVRIRKEPNTSSDILGTVYVGTKLDYIEKAGDWSKIKYNDGIGYIKSEYVTKQ